ncbi:ABC transporter permease [Actinotalea ferrariae]|uniref:ABC transporter permease n=1 Tax=Actinotalea ferrariae TaxID=1386098 RepID=UPI001C8BA111|nr:ABC transporter permease [Actinotalea ferrariae]MBX9243370.1 ABC transporter permease [Actinotalea ferrariae]
MSTPTPSPARTTADGRPRPPVPGVVPATLMVAEREILTQVRSKSFLISTGVLLLAVLASIVLGSVFAGRSEPTRVAVVPATADVVRGIETLEGVPVENAQEARELVESEEVAAAVLTDDNPTGYTVVALTEAPGEVMGALSVVPEVELLEEAETDEGLRYLVSFGFGLVFMMAAMTFGSTIAQNTVQEKQSRVVEILLSTVPARALLAGKILGNSALALGQTAALAAVAVIGTVATGQDELLSALGGPIAWFIIFFILGFVLLAAVFASSASLVSRIEDTGPVLSPVMMLTMAPYFVIVFFNDNPLVLTIASYVPFSAPVAMPVRLFLGEAAWWEPLASLLLLAIACVGVIALGARIYSRSLLRFSGRVRLKEALGDA